MATASQPTGGLQRSGDSAPMNPPVADDDILLSVRLSGEMNRRIEMLMGRMALSKGDVLNMAVGLLMVAVEATEQGKRIGIAGDDAELDTEFVGF